MGVEWQQGVESVSKLDLRLVRLRVFRHSKGTWEYLVQCPGHVQVSDAGEEFSGEKEARAAAVITAQRLLMEDHQALAALRGKG